ncbi:MAG: Asp-tRNA(Asn)/Glu-tRNA(Gln) amidotransferase subunit GatC [Actinomycetota bacterium]|nr:Asp-tRNA(Asn)/Glu-tRNA(Gln) amidotransferase subunit GatC [Actinomycetota bacterium]
MAIEMEDVEHVAKLARLKFTHEEMKKLKRELDAVLEHARVIESIETEGVPPTSHAIPLVNVYREDVCEPSLERDEVIKCAPWAGEQGFMVPKII